MLEDLTMMATLPVDAAAVKKAKDEDENELIDDDIDKAAAGETMPPPKEKSDDPRTIRPLAASPAGDRTRPSPNDLGARARRLADPGFFRRRAHRRFGLRRIDARLAIDIAAMRIVGRHDGLIGCFRKPRNGSLWLH